MSLALALGAVPADSSFVAAVSPKLETTGSFAARDASMIAAGLQTLQLPFDITQYPDCQGQSGTSVAGTALSIGGGLASSSAGLIAALSAASGPLAPAVAIGGMLVSLVGGIFTHHAQAVSVEQRDTCAAAPAANQALQTIDQYFYGGQATAAQCSSALDAILSNFRSMVAASYKVGPPCNWNCQMTRVLQAIVAKKKSIYADAEAAAKAAATAAPANTNPAPASGSATVAPLTVSSQATAPGSVATLLSQPVSVAGQSVPTWMLVAAAAVAFMVVAN